MSQCPNCRGELAKQDEVLGTCPGCGKPLHEKQEPSSPHAQSDVAMTIESAGMADDLSFEVVSHTTEDSAGAASETPSPTIDSSQLGSSEQERINQLWGPITDHSPSMTIKTQEPERERDQSASTLVIQERGIGRATEEMVDSLDYNLTDPIGEGGMGVVYAACQSSLDRQVAVKVLKQGNRSDQSQQGKFLSEAVVTGELEHPGIIPIYDLGRNRDGTLFYSMKRVHGDPWSAVIRQKLLTENLEILMKVCDAMAFAHSRDVIHRDLKPDNIMIGEFGEVLVLDWGLAVSVSEGPSSDNIARISTMGGTPAYMAPEMAAGPLEKIGKHSDIYLLGAILYECITGKLPRQRDNATACLFATVKNEIDPTEKKGELVDIALRAMSKECTDRYDSVGAFQDAIRAYQSHSESIALATRAGQDLATARTSDDYRDYARALFGFEKSLDLWPDNLPAAREIIDAKLAYAASAYEKGDYDLGLSLLQNDEPDHQELIARLSDAQRERDAHLQRLRAARRIMASLATLVFVVITTGIVLVWLAKQEADSQRDIARIERKEAVTQRREALNQKGIALEKEQEAQDQRKIADEQREVAITNEREAIAQRKAARQSEKEAIEQREKAEYETYVALIGLAAVKIDERAFSQAISLLEYCKPELRNWEWGRLMHLCRPENVDTFRPGHRIESVAFDKSGSRLAAAGFDGVVHVWDVRNGEIVSELELEPTTAHALAVCFSPIDSDLLAIGTNVGDRELQIWNMATGQLTLFEGHQAAVVDVKFNRDGSQLLTASKDHTAALWDVTTRKIARRFRGHDWWVWNASFSPDERLIVTASEDGTARIWDVKTGQQRTNGAGEPVPFTGHRGAVFAASFSPDGQYVATGGFDNRVLLWKPSELMAFDFDKMLSRQSVPAQDYQSLGEHTAAISSVTFSQDGRFLLSASHDNSLMLWSTRDQMLDGFPVPRGTLWKTLRGHSSQVRSAVFSPADANRVASASYDGLVRIWSIRDYEEERTISGTVLRGHADAIMTANFSPTGDYVITASRDRTAKSWDPRTGGNVTQFRQGHLFLVSDGIFYPDGSRLLTAAGDGSARAWNIANGAELFALQGIGHTAAIALSADGRWIVTAMADESVGSTDPADNRTNQMPRAVAAIWDGETGDRIRALSAPATTITAVAISPDAKMVFGGDVTGHGYIWNGESGELQHTLKWHTGRITDAAFTHDGSVLLTASDDKTVCQWRVRTEVPQPIEPLVLKHSDGVNGLCLVHDDTLVLTGDKQGLLHVWDRSKATEVWSKRLVNNGNVTSVDVSADGNTGLAVISSNVSSDKTVYRWDLLAEPTEDAEFLRFQDQDIWAATFAPDGDSILSLGGDEAVLWNRQAQPLKHFSPHRTVSFASYSPDAEKVVTAGWDHVARIWETQTGSPLMTLSGQGEGEQSGHTDRVNSAVFSADGRQVLTASEDGTIKLWDAQDASVVRTFRGHAGGVMYATFSPNGQQILSASRDHTACIWDIATGEEKQRLVGHSLAVWHAAFSADGTEVVTGSEDMLAKTWDVANGIERLTFNGHTAGVTSVTFSPDAQRILTGSKDQMAKLWDAGNAKEILSLKGHHQAVTSVAFSRDGRNALTSSRDGTAVIWPAANWTAGPELSR